jgi:putative PIN family toxin of toxin-antitoxin system
VRKGIKEKQQTGLRVVLDTNVYVSAFNFPEGTLREIWQHARRGAFELLISPAIVNELGRILRERFVWSERDIRARIIELSRIGEIVIPRAIPTAIEDDPADNHILACAIEGRANVIVSGDQHLRRLKEYLGIAIVRPADFLHMLVGY